MTPILIPFPRPAQPSGSYETERRLRERQMRHARRLRRDKLRLRLAMAVAGRRGFGRRSRGGDVTGQGRSEIRDGPQANG